MRDKAYLQAAERFPFATSEWRIADLLQCVPSVGPVKAHDVAEFLLVNPAVREILTAAWSEEPKESVCDA